MTDWHGEADSAWLVSESDIGVVVDLLLSFLFLVTPCRFLNGLEHTLQVERRRTFLCTTVIALNTGRECTMILATSSILSPHQGLALVQIKTWHDGAAHCVLQRLLLLSFSHSLPLFLPLLGL